MFKNIYRPLLTKHLYIGAYYLNIPFEQGTEEDNMNTKPTRPAVKEYLKFNKGVKDERALALGRADFLTEVFKEVTE